MQALRVEATSSRRSLGPSCGPSPSAILLATLVALGGSASAATVRREVRVVMGTMAEVRARGLPDSGGLDTAFAALDRVDALMSLWKESELAALNAQGAMPVSEETYAVLRHALEVAEASGGAFDPTVEPLVRAAGGFDAEPVPGDGRLLDRVSYRHVHLDPRTRTVRLDAGTRLVLDGIAKGYAVDLGLAALGEAGATSGLVNLGGSSLAVFGETFHLDVRDPTREGSPWASFRLENAAVGTSGDSERPGHIVDPRTGGPARGVLQATVVAASAMEADALSTAVFVLGAEEGLALLARRRAMGLVLRWEDGRRVIRTTPGFAAARALVAAPGVEVKEQGAR